MKHQSELWLLYGKAYHCIKDYPRVPMCTITDSLDLLR